MVGTLFLHPCGAYMRDVAQCAPPAAHPRPTNTTPPTRRMEWTSTSGRGWVGWGGGGRWRFHTTGLIGNRLEPNMGTGALGRGPAGCQKGPSWLFSYKGLSRNRWEPKMRRLALGQGPTGPEARTVPTWQLSCEELEREPTGRRQESCPWTDRAAELTRAIRHVRPSRTRGRESQVANTEFSAASVGRPEASARGRPPPAKDSRGLGLARGPDASGRPHLATTRRQLLRI